MLKELPVQCYLSRGLFLCNKKGVLWWFLITVSIFTVYAQHLSVDLAYYHECVPGLCLCAHAQTSAGLGISSYVHGPLGVLGIHTQIPTCILNGPLLLWREEHTLTIEYEIKCFKYAGPFVIGPHVQILLPQCTIVSIQLFACALDLSI